MAPRKLRLRDGLVSSTVSPVLTDGRSRSKMWPCTHTVETSLIWKQTVCPASISMPGEMSFCTITPEMGDRTASSVPMDVQTAKWKRSPLTEADGQCEFLYQPEGWGKACRFLALRYEKLPEAKESEETEQYQLFDTPEYTYRVFVTDMDGHLDALVWFYNQRAAAENLIKEANNDAGLTAHPSNRWMMNANWFQIAMLAYNLNCWLQLFSREENITVETINHTTLATARLRFLFLAARIWRHAGTVGVS